MRRAAAKGRSHDGATRGHGSAGAGVLRAPPTSGASVIAHATASLSRSPRLRHACMVGGISLTRCAKISMNFLLMCSEGCRGRPATTRCLCGQAPAAHRRRCRACVSGRGKQPRPLVRSSQPRNLTQQCDPTSDLMHTMPPMLNFAGCAASMDMRWTFPVMPMPVYHH